MGETNFGVMAKTSLLKKLSGQDIIGFEGHILWNKSKPNGQPRRCMNTTRAKLLLDWEAEYSLKDGLKETIDWYLNELELAGK